MYRIENTEWELTLKRGKATSDCEISGETEYKYRNVKGGVIGSWDRKQDFLLSVRVWLKQVVQRRWQQSSKNGVLRKEADLGIKIKTRGSLKDLAKAWYYEFEVAPINEACDFLWQLSAQWEKEERKHQVKMINVEDWQDGAIQGCQWVSGKNVLGLVRKHEKIWMVDR